MPLPEEPGSRPLHAGQAGRHHVAAWIGASAHHVNWGRQGPPAPREHGVGAVVGGEGGQEGPPPKGSGDYPTESGVMHAAHTCMRCSTAQSARWEEEGGGGGARLVTCGKTKEESRDARAVTHGNLCDKKL